MKGIEVRKIDLLTAFFITIIGFFLYSNTFGVPFLLDDLINIVENPSIRIEDLSWRSLTGVRSFYSEWLLDRPLAYATFALNYYFGGLNVFGFHLVNVIIHTITGTGVYLLIKAILEIASYRGTSADATMETGLMSEQGKRSTIAALAALLWLSSPVQTQAVTYIVQRMTSMAAMFYVYSILFFVKGRSERGGRGTAFISISIFLFVLSLLTKQNSVTLPLVLILYELCFSLKARDGGRTGLFLGLAAGILLAGGLIFISRDYLDIGKFLPTSYAFRERVMTEARVIMFYLSLVFVPVSSKLAFYHDFSLSRGLLSPLSTLPSLLFIAAVIIFCIFRIRKDPFVSFFVLWFFINILPESLFLQIYPVFEHRLYLPSIGFYAVLAYLGSRMLEKNNLKGRTLLVTAILIVAVFSINTYNRNKDWHSDLAIWQDNVKKSPDIPSPHEGLGMAYLNRNEFEMAERELRMAKSLDPLSSVASTGLGVLYYKKGEIESAFREFEYVAERKSIGAGYRYHDADGVFFKIGVELLEAGRIQDAERIFRLGLYLNPNHDRMKAVLRKLENGG